MKIKSAFLLFLFTTQCVFAGLMCDTNVSKYYARYTTNTYTCTTGQYLPANTLGCVACLYGYTCAGGTYRFNANDNQGITIGLYTCNSGYFLPANDDTCRVCPTGFTCPGGIFNFDSDSFQGLSIISVPSTQMNNICAINFPKKLYAKYVPNSHTCSAGQYLPAGVDACTQCPTGGNCSGGTYAFNETTNQGVDSCDSGYYKDNGTCVANTITVRWDDGNGGVYTTTCSYGGTLTTPTTPPVAPKGYHFTGWSFNLGN